MNNKIVNPTFTPHTYFERKLNLDITSKCVLKCPKCIRQHRDISLARDITPQNYEKICKVFKVQDWCGQQGDCIYHPRFHELCDIAMMHNCYVYVHTNGFGKKDKWWETTFEKLSVNNSTFIFAIDGLPETSGLYRINQDGEEVLEVMKQGVERGHQIIWKYIAFSYNENDINKASQIALDNGIKFYLVKSSRWNQEGQDLYKPKNKDLFL